MTLAGVCADCDLFAATNETIPGSEARTDAASRPELPASPNRATISMAGRVAG